jgi:hypothetical protein
MTEGGAIPTHTNREGDHAIMRPSQQHGSLLARRTPSPAILRALHATPGRVLGWLTGDASPRYSRRARRRMRRWLESNGLAVVVAFAMMVFAWMLAAR